MPVAVVLHPSVATELRVLLPELQSGAGFVFQCQEDDLEESAAGISVSACAAMTNTTTSQAVRMPGRIFIPWRLVSGCFRYASDDDIAPQGAPSNPIGFQPPSDQGSTGT